MKCFLILSSSSGQTKIILDVVNISFYGGSDFVSVIPFFCTTDSARIGIEAFVTENNPKYANRIIRQLKAYAKANSLDKNYDPYKAAYGSMPSHASANPEIKQLYINGHFCYVFKFGIITNGLGIIRHIAFYKDHNSCRSC